jgi:murein DD-endopeptidase MepM/ murein hydrolase activator NlpD
LKWESWAALLVLGGLLAACGTDSTSTPAAVPSETLPATIDELATLIALQEAATSVPTITPVPSATPSPLPTATPEPSATPTLTPTGIPTFTPFPTNTPRPVQTASPTPAATAVAQNVVASAANEHYWLARPFPRDSSNQIHDYASRSYPYGATAYGQFQTHHGVDIQNTPGTRILAAAAGTVFYAGDDYTEAFGPITNFYGNLVVIEHDLPTPNGETLYTLYGHMSQVYVETGDRVAQGEQIGEVGATGVALGPHLHFEVRLGDPHDYNRTYNPDLWLRPWPTFGTLAGRITERDGSRVYDAQISIRQAGGIDHYTFSYADDLVKSDPALGEHFTRGDLPEGEYEVFVRLRGVLRYQGDVTIESGKTTWLDIVLK